MVSVLVIPLQFNNALVPMLLTLSGMFNVPNDVQAKNDALLIVNKFPPSASAGILLQLANALEPIV
jgi:hypothetical protein